MGAELIHPFQIDRRLDLLGEVEPVMTWRLRVAPLASG
jgi:hypothetical protein